MKVIEFSSILCFLLAASAGDENLLAIAVLIGIGTGLAVSTLIIPQKKGRCKK